MTNEIRKLSQQRLSKARDTLKEAVVLLEKKFYRGAVNRFYYAAFYAARSLLATKELDSSKHSGVISLFHKHFVNTKLVDSEKAKALSRSFEKRQDSDYEDFASVTGEEVERIRKEVEEFVSECERVLRQMK
jgi:uncharacterized protein (UPF0332 family)